MARIVKKGTSLEKEYNYDRKKSTTYALISVAAFAIGTVINAIEMMGPVTFTLYIIGSGCLIGAIVFSNKTAISKAGVEGEDATERIILALPDSYTGFKNLKVTYEGKTSEIDMVVVGPTGIFIIETKNLKGDIVGNTENSQWIQYKTGRKGGEYSKTFYNPIKQVGTHVFRLARVLRANRITVYVNAMVYFSYPETAITVTGPNKDVKIFTAFSNGHRGILANILNGQAALSEAEINKIVSLLERL